MSSLLRAFVFLALSATSAFAVPPAISVPTATPGANGTASISVNVTANGADTTVTFNYGLTATYGSNKVVTVPASAVNQPTVANLTGLIGGQTYHYQVVASHPNTSESVSSVDQTFVEPAFAPTLTLLVPTHVGSVQTLHARVTPNGTAGTVFFQYGLTTAYGSNSTPGAVDPADPNPQQVNFDLPNPDVTYHYRFVFDTNADGTPEYFTEDDLSNDPPQAVADSAEFSGGNSITIEVLANDTDPNGDNLTITSVSAPKNGTATISSDAKRITYTPGPLFRGTDSFTYTIDDGFGGISSAEVTVIPLVASLAGTHGGFVKKQNGKEVGYFTLSATATGAFSGIAVIEGKKYRLTGTFGADGSFNGYATDDDGGRISVSLRTTNSDTGSVITATFEGGKYVADLTVSDTEGTSRSDVVGRFTAGLGAGGTGPSNGNDAGNPPAGTGWVALRVRNDGTASIKGRLSDGRSFSCKGTVNLEGDVPTLTFFDDPEGTRVVGNLTLGDSVGGTLRIDRHSSGEGLYPRGFDVTQTVDGARYVQPGDSKRVLDTNTSKGQDVTITFSGGNLPGTFSRDLVLDDRDKAKKISDDPADLKLRIDRKSGRFQAKITVDSEGRRIKATGVLIQAISTTDTTTGVTTSGTGGHGVGIFNTSAGTGTVTISASGSGGTPTPTPTPIPTPTPTPDPTDPGTIVVP